MLQFSTFNYILQIFSIGIDKNGCLLIHLDFIFKKKIHKRFIFHSYVKLPECMWEDIGLSEHRVPRIAMVYHGLSSFSPIQFPFWVHPSFKHTHMSYQVGLDIPFISHVNPHLVVHFFS